MFDYNVYYTKEEIITPITIMYREKIEALQDKEERLQKDISSFINKQNSISEALKNLNIFSIFKVKKILKNL